MFCWGSPFTHFAQHDVRPHIGRHLLFDTQTLSVEITLIDYFLEYTIDCFNSLQKRLGIVQNMDWTGLDWTGPVHILFFWTQNWTRNWTRNFNLACALELESGTFSKETQYSWH